MCPIDFRGSGHLVLSLFSVCTTAVSYILLSAILSGIIIMKSVDALRLVNDMICVHCCYFESTPTKCVEFHELVHKATNERESIGVCFCGAMQLPLKPENPQ